ncbi:MAG: PadR family transcriptional regulator [Candidatus Micrarchaeota archaeon]
MRMEHTPIRRLRNLLTNGNLWLYILSLINGDGELYAYALDKKIEEKFSFRPNRIMIYVVLYKLEAEGLIESKFRERRKYYRLTKTGHEALSRAREYFGTLSEKL